MAITVHYHPTNHHTALSDYVATAPALYMVRQLRTGGMKVSMNEMKVIGVDVICTMRVYTHT